jgi:hypothetical protein
MLSFPSCCFATVSANLHVNATVLPIVNFNAVQRITNYQVRNEDLLKGYIDLPNSITVTLRTNTNGRIPIIIDNWGIGKILIRESGTADFMETFLTVNASEYRTGEPINRNYDLRIVLPAETQEGIYPLNISMTTST